PAWDGRAHARAPSPTPACSPFTFPPLPHTATTLFYKRAAFPGRAISPVRLEADARRRRGMVQPLLIHGRLAHHGRGHNQRFVVGGVGDGYSPLNRDVVVALDVGEALFEPLGQRDPQARMIRQLEPAS